jgi:hypothetical protein
MYGLKSNVNVFITERRTSFCIGDKIGATRIIEALRQKLPKSKIPCTM